MRLPNLLAAAAVTAVVAAYAASHFDPDPDPPVYELRPADPAMAGVQVRSAAKDLLAREVIAGRVTLAEAAAVFGRLDALPPRQPSGSPEHTAEIAGLYDPTGYSGAEMAGVRVVARVAAVARRECPDRAAELTERARAAFRAARAAGAFARPPEVPEAELERLIERAGVEAARMTRPRPAEGNSRATRDTVPSRR